MDNKCCFSGFKLRFQMNVEVFLSFSASVQESSKGAMQEMFFWWRFIQEITLLGVR